MCSFIYKYVVFDVPTSSSLQQSNVVESLHPTKASVPTPCLVEWGGPCRVTWDRTSSTVSRCRSSSPSCSGLSRIQSAATAPPTGRLRCRALRVEPPSWASTVSASWPPDSCSAPSSGPGTSHTSQSSQSLSRSVKGFNEFYLQN